MWRPCVLVYVCVLSWTSVSAKKRHTSLQEIPDNATYAAADTAYNDGGMGPLYDFARSFINTSLPGGFPRDFINETMRDVNRGRSGLDIGKVLPKVLKTFAGYVAALVVGVLFVVVFPIVGCCVGCCRLCGNCGGKRKQTITSDLRLQQRIYEAILFVVSLFMLVGNICTYVSNSRMTIAIDTIENTVTDNLNDIDTYLDLVEMQIETIGLTNLDITKRQILENMDQTTLEKNITEYLLDELSGGALKTMETNIETTEMAFDTVATAAQAVHTSYNNVKALCGGCKDPTASQEFLDLESHKQEFESFKANSVADQVKNQLRTKIQSNLQNISGHRYYVQRTFQKIELKVHKVVDEVKTFKTNAKSGIDIDFYKRKVSSIANDAKTYDKYRYDVGAALAAMTTIIVILQLLGLSCGIVGTRHYSSPTERGCLSNSGGYLLIASAVFIFIFSSFLMLLTTVSFAAGSLLERFICQPLAPPTMELLEVANSYFPTKNTLRADLSNVIRDCRDGKTAYTAFHLNSLLNMTDVDVELHYHEKEIDKQMKQALESVRNIGNVDFSTTVDPSLRKFKYSLQSISFIEINKQLDQAKDALPDIPDTWDYRQTLLSLETALDKLERIKDQIDGWNMDLTTSLQRVTASLQVVTKMDKMLETYKDLIIDIAEVYVKSTKDNVENKVGKCTPLWNLYNSVLLISVCQYTVDAFNGFWFSIGWCIFFFIPAVIFAMKLSKHYHRMDCVEERSARFDRQESVGLSNLRRNKVTPSGDANGSPVA